MRDVIPIHRAGVAEAMAVASIHVTSWRETYADIAPGLLTRAPQVEERTVFWARALTPQRPGAPYVLLAERAGSAIGFIACGPQRSASLTAAGFDAEVGALYVLRAAQRLGAGSALMRAAAAQLAEAGFAAVALWALSANAAARGFYGRIGGAMVDERLDRDGFPETAYGWRDLSALAVDPRTET